MYYHKVCDLRHARHSVYRILDKQKGLGIKAFINNIHSPLVPKINKTQQQTITRGIPVSFYNPISEVII